MNVLGVVFDSRLNWSEHVSEAVRKSNRALCALRLIKRYLTSSNMRTLLISIYYSILYYNSEIWLGPHLLSNSKQQLLSASAKAIRSCMPLPNPFISFELVHKNCKFSTPTQVGLFKLSLLLYKTLNSTTFSKDWLELTDQIVITRRQVTFDSFMKNNYKIGLNILTNRFNQLKHLIDLDDFNLDVIPFKLKMKRKFKPYESC